MKRATLFLTVGLCAACASSAALAHADIGVFLGMPGPVYVAPPDISHTKTFVNIVCMPNFFCQCTPTRCGSAAVLLKNKSMQRQCHFRTAAVLNFKII